MIWVSTFGSSDVWEGTYTPLGLPVIAMEFDPATVMVTDSVMPSVAGSKAEPHCCKMNRISFETIIAFHLFSFFH